MERQGRTGDYTVLVKSREMTGGIKKTAVVARVRRGKATKKHNTLVPLKEKIFEQIMLIKVLFLLLEP
jgi:hypothetical protein